MKIRVGFGYDVHKLEEGRRFVLGGVEIENSPLGAVGHSDADVLIHAIIDALLGAANLRDIGFQYPDNDMKYKGIDSKELLKDTLEKVRNKGFEIENIDSTIALQSPKISTYIEKMKATLAEVMKIDQQDISIKATTTEKLGFEGRKEGVSAYSVCLLSKV
ncbi:MAG: 2-C-methyl-D-erythritol 2,4-cyclodiphosphate synthase [Bacteroidales bacterium]|nr:2-C-methyl-D-erythritol 2,4-cyclodiphosphate synthase [Bacteroidales bacterium]